MKRRLPYLIHDEGGQYLAEYDCCWGSSSLMAITLISFGVSVNLRFSDASGQRGGVAAGGGQDGAGSGDSVSGGGTGGSGGGGSSRRPADDNRESERFEPPTP